MKTPPRITQVPHSCLAEVNSIYARLKFEPSRPDVHTTWWIGGAEILALGRMCRLAPGNWEVGGFWTAPAQRGQGFASAMIGHAMAHIPPGDTGWCLPLTPLLDFYRSFGMSSPEAQQVPPAVAARSERCHADGHCSSLLTFEAPPRPRRTGNKDVLK